MGKEAVLIAALLLAILVIAGAIAVEKETRETTGGEETPDIEIAPVENTDSLCSIGSPINKEVYNTQRIFFNISSEKKLESIKYIDYSDRDPAWRTLCSKCKGYENEKILEGGWHNISIKCKSSRGEWSYNLEFLNDYTRPRISLLKPSSGFSNGSDFRVKYTEDNLKSVLFWVRNATAEGSDKPQVELFVLAHCPFCHQAEKGLLPVVDLLGGNFDFKIRFVHFMLHGEEEKEETYRQVCIREEQPEKYVDYLRCFAKSGDYESCLDDADIEVRELEECFFNRAEGYYAEDANLSEAYGIEGTPTLVINGIKTEFVQRSAASSLRLICSQLDKVPDECFSCLSSQDPFPGFWDYDAFECEEGQVLGDWVWKQCPSGKNQECSFDADLSEFDGQDIEYFFAVRDLAGNVDVSRPVKVRADVSMPITNNGLFWEQGSGREKRFIYFSFSITEENFDKITYSYTDSKGRLKEGILCNNLRDGICKKKKSFLPGDYDLAIEVLDKAGNSIKEIIIFTIK